jgi:predicted RecA/RadA family phage recombinase
MSQPTTDKYAEACVRIAEEVAVALTAALGEEWAEWGEGGLADGVRMLAQQRADAEKRGAVNALRIEAMRGREAVDTAKISESPFKNFAVHLMTGLSKELDRRADAIESGEVTL